MPGRRGIESMLRKGVRKDLGSKRKEGGVLMVIGLGVRGLGGRVGNRGEKEEKGGLSED